MSSQARVLCGIAAIAIGWAAWSAPSAAASIASADVVRSSGCVFFDAAGDAHFDADARLQIVRTNNARGTAAATCHGSLPDGADAPSQAMHFDFASTGFTCIGSEVWTMTVTPSGHASFSCRI
jgi:hypothetical protein